MKGSVALIIHGTAVDAWYNRMLLGGGPWWEPESCFCQAIQQNGAKGCQVLSFEWSGKNSHQARIEAAQDLVTRILDIRQALGAGSISLVGHSHGGNIALMAANYLSGSEIQDIVLLANPNMAFCHPKRAACDPELELGDPERTGCQGERCHWLYWGTAPQRIQGRICNLYSPQDSVQTFVVRQLHGLWREKKPPGAFLAVSPVYRGHYQDRVLNHSIGWKAQPLLDWVEHRLKVRGRSAHSAMHSERMGRVIGMLLKGKTINEALALAGLEAGQNEIEDVGWLRF